MEIPEKSGKKLIFYINFPIKLLRNSIAKVDTCKKLKNPEKLKFPEKLKIKRKKKQQKERKNNNYI